MFWLKTRNNNTGENNFLSNKEGTNITELTKTCEKEAVQTNCGPWVPPILDGRAVDCRNLTEN